MKVLRDNKDSVMAMLEAFVYDPLISWKLLTGKKDEIVPIPPTTNTNSNLGNTPNSTPTPSHNHTVKASPTAEANTPLSPTNNHLTRHTSFFSSSNNNILSQINVSPNPSQHQEPVELLREFMNKPVNLRTLSKGDDYHLKSLATDNENENNNHINNDNNNDDEMNLVNHHHHPVSSHIPPLTLDNNNNNNVTLLPTEIEDEPVFEPGELNAR